MKNPYLLFKNIRQARIQAGFSQKDLAKRLGVTDKAVSTYETGRAIPPTTVLASIARATDTSLLELMGMKEKKSEGALSKKLDTLAEKIFEIGEQIKKSMDVFVGVVLVDENQRTYLIREDDKNKIGKNRWNLPGGSVDEGESLIAAAIRETKEETGFDAKITSQVGSYMCKKGNKRWVYIVFGAKVEDHKQEPIDTGVKEGRWFEKEEFLKMNLDDLVHSDMKLVYSITIEGRGLLTESIKYIDYDLQ